MSSDMNHQMVTDDITSSSLPLPPGNYGLPVIGNTLNYFFDPNFIKKRSAKYGSIFKNRILGFDAPFVILLGADANKFILTNENKLFVSYLPESTRKLFGTKTIALQTGNVHLGRRKILAKAFQPRRLDSYSSGMINITKKYLDRWEKLDSFDWYAQLHNYTFDIATKLLIGLNDASNTPFEENYQVWGKGIFSLPLNYPGSSYTKAKASMYKLFDIIDQIINRRISESNSTGDDVLDILLSSVDEQGNKLSLDEVKEQILTILFAGHDTLTSSLSSFCILLDQYQDIKNKCRNEILECNLSNDLTLDKLNKAVYIGQVLKEVLRRNPPVAGVFRKVIKECEYGGYKLPIGWNVGCSFSDIHRDENYYPFSDLFEPDRFSEDFLKERNKDYSYLPYSSGVRDCLGQEFANLEMKIFAVYLLSKYDWSLDNKHPIKMGAIPFLHPVGGLPVKFWRI